MAGYVDTVTSALDGDLPRHEALDFDSASSTSLAELRSGIESIMSTRRDF